MKIPKTKTGIRSLIKKIEGALKYEKRTFGSIGDRAGARYLLGPLYLLMEDVEGALKSFRWFENEFPDDVGDPFQYLSWALAYYKSGQLKKAEGKFIQTMLLNLYLIPYILGDDQPVYDIWHGSNVDEKGYLNYLPEEYKALWDDAALKWTAEAYEGEKARSFRNKYIEIQHQLLHEPAGPTRTRLVEKSFDLLELIWRGD
ncbi:MAG: hypothetical protein HQ591_09130 [candidate division Zixibacteria bacterium]|nr:hypothetical protein [Candidatus Tariuqbacter arcticus]